MAKPDKGVVDPAGGQPPAGEAGATNLKTIQANIDSKKTEGLLQRAQEAGVKTKLKVVKTADGVEPKAAEPAAATEPPKPDAIDYNDPAQYQKFYETLPVAFREVFSRNVVGNVLQNVQKTVGPEVYSVLTEVMQDADVRKGVAKLNNKQLRQWLFDTAVGIYEDPKYNSSPEGSTAVPTAPAPDPRVDAIEARLKAEDAQRQQQTYAQARSNELRALISEVPTLRYDPDAIDSPEYKRVQEIMDYAETLGNRMGRYVSYKEAFDRVSQIYSASPTPPPSIPNTNSGFMPPPAEGPKTDKESSDRMRQVIAKHGSLTALARSISGG